MRTLDIALSAAACGISVVPPLQDGSKRPMQSWKDYQRRRADPQQICTWYRTGLTGLGFVCGAVSGNLEAFEFDDRDTYEAFKSAALGTGLGNLVERVEAGYLEESPSGGIHWLTRCAEIAGNTKLARRPGPLAADGNPAVKVLIETRGEGGYIVVAPSFGKVHPTGKSYQLLRGGVETIATLTPNERRALWELARTFDQMPRPATSVVGLSDKSVTNGDRPGDVFNQQACWAEILEPRGWRLVFRRYDGVEYWRRPGKRHGWSATVGYGGHDVFYVWTSSSVFEPERGYTKFSAFTILEHAGDFGAAARDVAERYGLTNTRRPKPLPQPTRPAGLPVPPLQRPAGIPVPTPTRPRGVPISEHPLFKKPVGVAG